MVRAEPHWGLEPHIPFPGPKRGEEGVEALHQAHVPPSSGPRVFGWLKGHSQRDDSGEWHHLHGGPLTTLVALVFGVKKWRYREKGTSGPLIPALLL